MGDGVQSVQLERPGSAKPQWPDQARELAYQLWAFATSRNAREVARQLAAGEYGEDLAIPHETISYWAREYNWAERAANDVQAIAPDLRHQAFSELLFAGLDGAKYIRRVNAGQEAPDKVRAQLAIAAVDRIGFSPIGNRDPSGSITAPRARVTITHDVTDEELEAIEESARAGRVESTQRKRST